MKKYILKFPFLGKNNKAESTNTFNVSYAQSGEDLIIDFALNSIGVKTRFYLDVGTNDPENLNNTYLFYKNGHNGICVEPDPGLFDAIKKSRPNDVVINVGLSDKKSDAKFYIMEPNTLNTFSKNDVDNYRNHYPWVKLRETKKIPVTTINRLLDDHKAKKGDIDILSIETEGLDTKIIKSMNINKYRPKIICVETADYLADKTLSKNNDLIKYIQKHNYFIYADTFVNTILIDRELWEKCGGAKLKGF